MDKKIVLSDRQICDLELITNGGFYPLTGFLNEKDYYSVLSKMKLSNGIFWPIPINLDVNDAYKVGEEVILCDEAENPLANLIVESIYMPDKKLEARLVYSTESTDHFGVNYLFNKTKKYYLGGKVKMINKINRSDFINLRHNPESLKKIFKEKKWKRVIGFQTRNPIHRAHFALIQKAAYDNNAKILIHPSVGLTKDGDIDYKTRVKCYEIIEKKYAKNFAFLSLLPLAMRMAGPREALLHAIIRKNYGCTDFIVGRAHADPGNDSKGIPFYKPFDAQKMAIKYAKEIGINIIPFQEMAYDEKRKKYVVLTAKNKDRSHIKRISGTKFREMLRDNKEIPAWFSFPEVINVLRKNAEKSNGFTIFLTGLPCSGKSTIAKNLASKLEEDYLRKITLLDGDVVRKNLSRGLSFSDNDRKENIRRIGFVANEVVRHGGIAICSAISPFADVRSEIRNLISENGTYVEIYLSTPLSVCEKRDVKGLYKKARRGLIKGFTGIDSVYEKPENPEIVLDTSKLSVEKCIDNIIGFLKKEKIITYQ